MTDRRGGAKGAGGQHRAKKTASSSRASLARIKAYECLEAVRTRGAFANEVIDKVVDGSSLDASDRAFATRLVLGVVSMRGTLDAVLDMCMRSPTDVEPDVRDALCISTYEILYLGKSAHAAVDQGVELVRHVQPKAAGVANAVLRKVLKARESFPFGDPAKSIKAYALLTGFPLWLVERLFRDMGSERAHDFIEASNEPAPAFLAVNPIKGDAEAIVSNIVSIGTGAEEVDVEGIHVKGCFRISNPKILADKRFKWLVNDGKVLVSDAAAQVIAQIACDAAIAASGGKSGNALSCLELCAGRGTKTVLLQRDAFQATGEQFGRFVAVDNVAFKTRLLSERAQQYGVDVTDSLCCDLLKLGDDVEQGSFDLVFLDSPCSGLGTLRRHPEIRWRIAPDVIEADSELDKKLIAAASRYVKEGGILAYSTCTVTPEENVGVVKAFLESPAGSAFGLVPVNGRPAFASYLTPGGCDAHFCAIMCRKEVR